MQQWVKLYTSHRGPQQQQQWEQADGDRAALTHGAAKLEQNSATGTHTETHTQTHIHRQVPAHCHFVWDPAAPSARIVQQNAWAHSSLFRHLLTFPVFIIIVLLFLSLLLLI